MKPPYPELHRDVVLGPLLPGSNKHRFIFETSPAGVPLPHYRQNRSDTTLRTEMSAEAARSAERVGDPTVYAGPYINHFGHFVAECIHRLYPRRVFRELSATKVAFHVGARRTFALDRWAIDVLRLCGVNRHDVIPISRPIRFSELYVPIQGRTLGGPSLVEDYPKLLPFVPRALTRVGAVEGDVLYVSRSRHFYSGSYLGESYVERSLAEAGVTILYPESLPIAETVGRLRVAKAAIFSEGSAIHNLELCGRTGIRVFVIGRRSGVAQRLGRMLDDFTAEWRMFEPSQPGVPLDWDTARDKPSLQRSSAYPRLGALIQELGDFIGTPLEPPSSRDAFDAISADLVRYILDPRSTRKATSNEKLGELLRLLRRRHAQVERSWDAIQDGSLVRTRRKS